MVQICGKSFTHASEKSGRQRHLGLSRHGVYGEIGLHDSEGISRQQRNQSTVKSDINNMHQNPRRKNPNTGQIIIYQGLQEYCTQNRQMMQYPIMNFGAQQMVVLVLKNKMAANSTNAMKPKTLSSIPLGSAFSKSSMLPTNMEDKQTKQKNMSIKKKLMMRLAFERLFRSKIFKYTPIQGNARQMMLNWMSLFPNLEITNTIIMIDHTIRSIRMNMGAQMIVIFIYNEVIPHWINNARIILKS